MITSTEATVIVSPTTYAAARILRAGFVIFIYSMLFTSLVSFFAVMIIPDSARPQFLDNLIGGLSMYLAGPVSVRLLFHGFVVLVGTLILAGAVNTAIIGSNGVLNRVAEDGVLPDWFRHPHHKFGTTSRLINLILWEPMAAASGRPVPRLLKDLLALVIFGIAASGIAAIVFEQSVAGFLAAPASSAWSSVWRCATSSSTSSPAWPSTSTTHCASATGSRSTTVPSRSQSTARSRRSTGAR